MFRVDSNQLLSPKHSRQFKSAGGGGSHTHHRKSLTGTPSRSLSPLVNSATKQRTSLSSSTNEIVPTHHVGEKIDTGHSFSIPSNTSPFQTPSKYNCETPTRRQRPSHLSSPFFKSSPRNATGTSAPGGFMSNLLREAHLTPKASLKSSDDGLKKSLVSDRNNGNLTLSAKKDRVLYLTPTSKKIRSKTKQYDRFIPNRQTMDMASAQFQMKEGPIKPQHLDQDALAYQKQLADACGIALGSRILAFNVEPPAPEKHDLRTTWNRPLRPPQTKIAKRRIPTIPEKVLDAPGLSDDFYLNLLDWSPKNILAVGLDKSVYLWNADTGDVQEFCQTHEDDYVSSVKWTLDGSYLAIGTGQGDAQIWDVDSLSKIRSMKGHVSRVGVLSWNKHTLSSGARDGSIWNHDVRIAKHKVAELGGHSSEVCGLTWRPDGHLLASGGNDNLVNIWDARASVPMHTKSEHRAAVKALAWCPWQLSLLASGGGTSDQMIHFWNANAGSKLSSIHAGSQVTSIIWSRQYKEVLTSHGFPNNYLSIWSYPSLQKVVDLPGHESRILHTALSPDGQTVASASSDENLKFWKVFEARKKPVKSQGDDIADELTKSYQRLTIR